jgi:hypothetical protein
MSSEASPISAQLRRTYLANRRINCSEAIAFSGVALLVALGFDASGVAREIFVEGLRQGSDLAGCGKTGQRRYFHSVAVLDRVWIAIEKAHRVCRGSGCALNPMLQAAWGYGSGCRRRGRR